MPAVTCALGPDSAGTLLARFLRAEAARIDAAVYEVSAYYAFLFAAAAGRGGDVRLLLDAHAGANSTTTHLLSRGPAACRVVRGARAEAHWKIIVADRDRLAVGSGNLIRRDAPRDPGGRLPPEATATGPGTREWWVFVAGAPTLATTARADVTRVWRLASPPPRIAELSRPSVVPPVGVPNPLVPPITLDLAARRLMLATSGAAVAALIEGLISLCGGRILLTVPYVHTAAPRVRALLASMVEAGRRGVRVGLLLGGPAGPGDSAALLGLGLDTRVMDPVRSTTGHAKGVVVDRSVVVGSANWSEAGLGPNWEAAVRVDDERAADYYAAAWERDWGVATPLEDTLPGRGSR